MEHADDGRSSRLSLNERLEILKHIGIYIPNYSSAAEGGGMKFPFFRSDQVVHFQSELSSTAVLLTFNKNERFTDFGGAA